MLINYVKITESESIRRLCQKCISPHYLFMLEQPMEQECLCFASSNANEAFLSLTVCADSKRHDTTCSLINFVFLKPKRRNLFHAKYFHSELKHLRVCCTSIDQMYWCGCRFEMCNCKSIYNTFNKHRRADELYWFNHFADHLL